MDNFLKFANENPIIIVLLASIWGWTIVTPFRLFFRSRNIKHAGWPPPHLDADGDIHRKKDEEDDE